MGKTSNGWPWKDTGLATFTAPNGHVTSVANHSLAVVFAYVAYRWHTEIEPVTACFGNRTTAEQRAVNPSVMDSNHISATAVDINGGKHPYELTSRGWSSGFTSAQVTRLRSILSATGVIQTGLDFGSPWRDPMHVQIKQDARASGARVVSQAAVDAAAKKLGNEIKSIQKAVGVAQDGLPGPGTIAAIKSFQKKHGLTQDAIWGPKSQAAAGQKPPASKPPATTPKPSGRPTIKQGSKGTDVKTLQALLLKNYPSYAGPIKKAGGADGVFGAGTTAVVKEFQKRSHLTADGIVGPATWKALGL